MAASVKYTLIVKVPRGLNVLDTPRPQGQGALVRRAEAVGKALDAYSIHNIAGVPYARLVPRDPTKPEWVRVREADNSIEYVDIIELDDDPQVVLAKAILELASAIRDGKG